jgi:hypothetical protein
MKKIWKFEIHAEYALGAVTWEGRQVIPMPCGAVILSVGLQEGRPMLWALVNPEAPLDKRTVHIVATGSELGDEFGGRSFIGTLIFGTGGIILHVFE